MLHMGQWHYRKVIREAAENAIEKGIANLTRNLRHTFCIHVAELASMNRVELEGQLKDSAMLTKFY